MLQRTCGTKEVLLGFMRWSGQGAESLELAKISQSLIKGERWTVGSDFRDFTSQENKREES
jgi:hypothetical protein